MGVRLALPLLAGCSAIFGLDHPERLHRDADVVGGDGMVDGDLVDASLVDAAPMSDGPLGPWGNVTQPFMTSYEADDVTLTSDMLEMYFNRGNSNIYVTTRASTTSAWATPVVVSELSSSGTNITPEVTGDGLRIVFSSNRAPSSGYDLWVSTRASRADVWGAPVSLGSGVNSSATELAGSSTTTENEMVYSADRITTNDDDIYLTARGVVAQFPAGTRLAFNTTQAEGSAFLTGDGQTLYFSRVEAATMADLYVTYRMGDTWSTPQPITELNTSVPDSDPWVSPDGRHMFFCRHVGGKFQIFEATR